MEQWNCNKWNDGTNKQWNNGTVEQWNNKTMELWNWNHVTM